MPSEMLEAGLAYARMHWRVFPTHGAIEGPDGKLHCTCGKPRCSSPAKHPRTKNGFRDATDDPEQIRKWFTRWPDSNIGIATGSGIAVIDVDGPEGAAELKELVQAHGALPSTLVSATGRGNHIIFSTRPDSSQVRSSARGSLHVRGEGGFIIGPPSRHISGRTYQWVKKHSFAELPNWLYAWSQGYETSNKTPIHKLGPLPAYLQGNTRDISALADSALKSVWSPSEQARLTSALSAIPANSHDSWVTVGMALKDLGWQTNEGDIGYDIWIAWSETCPEKFALQVCEDRWRSFKRSGVSVGSIYHMAREKGWTGGAPAPGGQINGTANGVNGNHALPAAFPAATQGAIFFPDVTEKGKALATRLNAKVAIVALGVGCRYDMFHRRLLVEGELVSQWRSRELSDPVITMVRDRIRYKFGFDPGTQHTRDAAETLCYDHMFDPVLDYLDSLKWDGIPRLERWLTTYLGAAESEYTRAVARLSLLAAVRRARVPATKFDQIIVLEGKQGAGKSEAIRILAGSENFSDQKILGVDERKQQELTEGVWLYEIAELAGLGRADIDQVKTFVSRLTDRARPAYGRYTVHQDRRVVFFGSVNPGQPYLQDDTGNRRFWPIVVGRIDLAALRRDRDQLWAEASMLEAQGASHELPERLWAAAATEQESRVNVDEWSIPISNYIALKGRPDYSIMEVLTDNQWLQISQGDVDQRKQSRAARIMRGLDFVRFQKRMEDGRLQWRYRKP